MHNKTLVEMFNSLPYNEKEELFSIAAFPTTFDMANFNIHGKYQAINIDEHLLTLTFNSMKDEDITSIKLLNFTVTQNDQKILDRFISKNKLLNEFDNELMYMEDAIYMLHRINELLSFLLTLPNRTYEMRHICDTLVRYLNECDF